MFATKTIPLILFLIIQRFEKTVTLAVYPVGYTGQKQYSLYPVAYQTKRPLVPRVCFINNIWLDCTLIPRNQALLNRNNQNIFLQHTYEGQPGPNWNYRSTKSPLSSTMLHNLHVGNRRNNALNLLPSFGQWPANTSTNELIKNPQLNLQLGNSLPTSKPSDSTSSPPASDNDMIENITTEIMPTSQELFNMRNESLFSNFTKGLDNLERNFYLVTFNKLASISPVERQENGISFVQSGLFLQLALMALSTEVSQDSKAEINKCTGLQASEMDKIAIIKQVISSLPKSNNDVKFRWASRLALWPNQNVSQSFRHDAASALNMSLESFAGTENPSIIAKTLNHMVEIDSGGAIRDTFEEDELSDGVTAVLFTTLYLRARWRSAPTVLNGTRPFRDVENAPKRNVRMIRINDIMRYADLREWNAEAVEIFYATPGFSLLILVPRGNSLRDLSGRVAETKLSDVASQMRTVRVAATLPLYTLRMTLLLPNKLQDMGISRLVSAGASNESLTLSHAVQRIMFWAEAGRNAFKDDGLEWDEAPELELVVDRPYIFFVRWQSLVLMNGHFVL